MKWGFLILRWFLGAVFLYAGIIKSSASAALVVTLIPFMALIGSWIGPVAVVLPWVEVLAGALTLIGPKKWGPLLILFLCVIYIAVLGWALANGIIVACSCFGADETPSAWKMEMALLRDVGLAAIAIALLCEKPQKFQKP